MNQQTDLLEKDAPAIINMEVIKLNITDTEIAKMKAEYLPLTINGIEDKAGLQKVYESRQIVKKTRTSLVKYADQLKEKSLAWQRKVNGEKNRIAAELEDIEAHLQGEENKIEAAKQAIRDEAERVKKEKIQSRIDSLAPYGATIELVYLESLSDDQFVQVVANAKVQFELTQSRLAEEKRIAEEAALQLKKDQEELAALRKSQADAQAIIDNENARVKKEQEDKEAAIKAEQDRQKELADRLQGQKIYQRQTQLIGLGMEWNRNGEQFIFDGIVVNNSLEVKASTDESWNTLIAKITPAIEEKKKVIAEKKAKELGEKNKEIAAKALADKAESDKQKAIQEEEKLNQSSDKNKFKVVISTFSSITIPEMKSVKAKKLSIEVKELIQKIIQHINQNI